MIDCIPHIHIYSPYYTTHCKLLYYHICKYLSSSLTIFAYLHSYSRNIPDTPDNKLVRLSWWRIAKWVLFASLVLYFIGSIYVMQTLDALLLIKVCTLSPHTIYLIIHHHHPINETTILIHLVGP